MAHNVRIIGADTPRALGNVCLEADDLRNNRHHVDLQARQITTCLKCCPTVAAVFVAYGFGRPENWRRA